MFASKLTRLALSCVSAGTVTAFVTQKKLINSTNLWFTQPIQAAVPETINYMPTGEWDFNWDLRQPEVKLKENESMEEESKVELPTATRHILLIRHGQYHYAKDDTDCKLTAKGCKQAKQTGVRLKELDLKYTGIVESTMQRAKETSAIIQELLPNVPVKTTDLLREGAPIKPEPPHPTWKPTPKSFYADGARIEAAFRKFIHRASPSQTKDSVEVYVCHANVIRYFVCRALQFPPEGWLRMNLGHGSITWITIRPNGKVSIRCLGEVGHLPSDLISFQ